MTPPDLDHPAFPHGTKRGYNLGCRAKRHACPAQPTCTKVATRSIRLAEYRRCGALAPADTTRVPVGPVLEHFEELMRVPNASYRLIAGLCGLNSSTLALLGRPGRKTVELGTARAVMGVGVGQVRAVARRPLSAKAVQQVRSLYAQAWSREWICERIECPPTTLTRLLAGQDAENAGELEAKIDALARRTEGVTGPHTRVAQRARKKGWYPLAAYDDLGELIPGAVRREKREERKLRRDALARQRLSILVHSLLHRKSTSRTAAAVDVSEALVTKIRREAGLYFYPDHEAGEWESRVREHCAERAEQVAAVLQEYTEDPLADAFETARRIGLMESSIYDIESAA